MNQAKLAEARRLYHHVCNGGTLTPENVSFMVVALEEAYEQVEVDRLRAKKKQIYEDLKSEQTHNMKGEVTYDPETGEPLTDGYPLYSGLPNRQWTGLTAEELQEIGDACEWTCDETGYQIFDQGGYTEAIEAKLKEKNT